MTTDGHGRRLRVLIVGSSVGYYVRPPGDGADEQAVDECLEQLLRTSGFDADVRNASRWFETLLEGNRRLPDLLTWFRPHVVVVLFGYIESQPLVCPRWFAKWLFNPWPRSDRWSARARAILLPRGRRVFLQTAPLLARLPGLPSRVAPDRVRRETEHLAALARKERGALVLCANVPATDDRIESFLPTTGRRLRQTSAAIEAAVANSDARLVDLRALVDADRSELLPDGIHLSVLGHRMLAERLHDEIGSLLSGS